MYIICQNILSDGSGILPSQDVLRECVWGINIYIKMKQTAQSAPVITTNDMYAVWDLSSDETVSYPLTRYEDIFIAI